MKKILSALTALGVAGAAAVTGVVFAVPAEASTFCGVSVTAVQVNQNSSTGFVDVANATGTCTDVSTTVHTADIEFEWYYLYNGSYSPMPACPTRVVAPEVVWVGAVAVDGVATCERPVASGAYNVPRRVCATLLLDGIAVDEKCDNVRLGS